MAVNVIDHREEIKGALPAATERALERCGLQAEGYAKDLAPSNKQGYGGALKQSITHKVDTLEQAVYIGTNLEYAAFVELGTGKHREGGGGRPGWWVYVKGGGTSSGRRPSKIYTEAEARQIVAILRSKGLEAYMTEGQKPQPYLKPAIADHKQTYQNIIKDELENA